MNTSVTKPSNTTSEPPKCRFRLDNESSDALTLPDGRKLGYAQYGSLTGLPILYQHGLPGSRLEAASLHDLGLELGARIIAVDRPGIGWSSPNPNRKLLDHPKDLKCLVEHLGLEKYSVVGVSGGGPYALACAAALPPSKLKSVAIVCGLGPPDIGMGGANWFHWLGFTYGYRYCPSFLSRFWWRRYPGGLLELSDEERLQRSLDAGAHLQKSHAKDSDILTDPDFLQLSLRSARESFVHGYGAVWEDGKLMSSPWGFQIQNIRSDLPVQLWYGKEDTFVPLNHGKQITARLGDKAVLRTEDEAHAGIWVNWKREILKNLVESM